YHFTANGWLQPVPDPKADGWGVFFGQLDRSVSRFVVRLRNESREPASVRFRLDNNSLSVPAIVRPGEEKEVSWPVQRKSGPVRVQLVGDQDLVITETRFE
ncbi:MAG: hypothetical protein QHI38_05360, partial [Armatimonadota bacterium]|nr:hypothetical protein [Armatimonadota bacterium]